jgi:hypothetical protein
MPGTPALGRLGRLRQKNIGFSQLGLHSETLVKKETCYFTARQNKHQDKENYQGHRGTVHNNEAINSLRTGVTVPNNRASFVKQN